MKLKIRKFHPEVGYIRSIRRHEVYIVLFIGKKIIKFRVPKLNIIIFLMGRYL